MKNKLLILALFILIGIAAFPQQVINGYRIFNNVSTPATPASGTTAVYVDSSKKRLATVDDGGTAVIYGQIPLVGGGANCTTTATTTVFFKIDTSVTCNSTEVQSREMLPFGGTVTNFCVNIGSTQSATGSLTFTIKDETTGSTAGTISLVIAGGSVAGTYCDNSGSTTIIAQHEYDVVMVNAATTTSANINGFSSILTR